MNKKLRCVYRCGMSQILIRIFLAIVVVSVLYPMVYIVSSACAPGTSIASLSSVPFVSGFSAVHFKQLLTDTPYLCWFRNTFIAASATAVLTTFAAAISAYIFSRFSFPLKKRMMTSLLILQIFPSFLGMVAVYVILLRLHCIDTLRGLVLVYTAGNIPYSVWLVKSYIDTVPRSLDEAARIDGAGNVRIFFQIIVPVISPILIFLAITSFSMPWMDFIFPKLILRSPEKKTLALGLFGFVTDKKNEFTLFAAGALPVALPFVFFFSAARKIMISSFGAAAVKE